MKSFIIIKIKVRILIKNKCFELFQSKIECELYCITHQSSSNTYKIVQRNYTICEVQQKQLDQREKLNVCFIFKVKSFKNFIFFKEEILQTLTDHWSVYKKRSESFPRLPKPAKSHLARQNKNKNKLFFYIKIFCKDH